MFDKVIETNTSTHVKHFFDFPQISNKQKEKL